MGGRGCCCGSVLLLQGCGECDKSEVAGAGEWAVGSGWGGESGQGQQQQQRPSLLPT